MVLCLQMHQHLSTVLLVLAWRPRCLLTVILARIWSMTVIWVTTVCLQSGGLASWCGLGDDAWIVSFFWTSGGSHRGGKISTTTAWVRIRGIDGLGLLLGAVEVGVDALGGVEADWVAVDGVSLGTARSHHEQTLVRICSQTWGKLIPRILCEIICVLCRRWPVIALLVATYAYSGFRLLLCLILWLLLLLLDGFSEVFGCWRIRLR